MLSSRIRAQPPPPAERGVKAEGERAGMGGRERTWRDGGRKRGAGRGLRGGGAGGGR